MPPAPSPLQPITEPVFHYTSAAGLVGILGSGELWASEAASLNDLGEIRQGWKYVRRWLKSQGSGDAHDLWMEVKGLADQTWEPFVLSASLLPDDAGQWRMYADEARGYALELDPSVQLGVVGSGRRPSSNKSRLLTRLFRDSVTVSPWYRCLYEDSVKDEALEWVLAQFGHELDAAAADAQDEEDAAIGAQAARDEALSGLAVVASLIKSQGFSGEDEARVVATPLMRRTFEHYRATEIGVVSYLKLRTGQLAQKDPHRVYPKDKSERQPLPIRSVTYGARLLPEGEPSLKGLLESAGNADVDVRASKVPLR